MKRVLERAHDTLLGRYEVAEPFGVVVPEDPRIPYDIFTQRSAHPEIEDGSLVRVRIHAYPSRNEAATGEVVEVLCEDGADIGNELVIARHDFQTAFPADALAQAAEAKVDAEGALAHGYRDLRERCVFTIDPRDAKDFDDAVSCDEVERGGRRLWRIGVHIADVSHYVAWSSPLDLCARSRSTSVYLPGRVVPMLPEHLSNDICSLRPGEDRRTMTVDLFVDESGILRDYDIYPALIRSNARLTYEEALEVIEQSEVQGSSPCDERIVKLAQLTAARLERRRAAGALEFKAPEAKIYLDEAGAVSDIVVRTSNAATSLIEECMVWANEVVATHLVNSGFPCLFRVHEQPAADSLKALHAVLLEFPWYAEIDDVALCTGNAHAVQKVLAKSTGRPEEALVHALTLRSMKRALYKPETCGHYGLGLGNYAHFTSPIRRYPDLVVHRLLKASLSGRPEKFDQLASSLPTIADHASERERAADDAAREANELKLAEYLQAYIGQRFSATISGVAMGGIFVQLDNTAEGFVPVRELGAEYFAFDATRHSLSGDTSGRIYRLGQRIVVVLASADARTGRLEFKPFNREV